MRRSTEQLCLSPRPPTQAPAGRRGKRGPLFRNRRNPGSSAAQQSGAVGAGNDPHPQPHSFSKAFPWEYWVTVWESPTVVCDSSSPGESQQEQERLGSGLEDKHATDGPRSECPPPVLGGGSLTDPGGAEQSGDPLKAPRSDSHQSETGFTFHRPTMVWQRPAFIPAQDSDTLRRGAHTL